MTTQAERIAAIEERVKNIDEKVNDIHGVVYKDGLATLVAANCRSIKSLTWAVRIIFLAVIGWALTTIGIAI